MARTTCEACGSFVEVVPWIPDSEIGLVPQRLRQHRTNGRAFTGPVCPGSGREVRVWAVAEQREAQS